MSEPPAAQRAPPHAAGERTAAEVRPGRWPGWIWAVPLAAVAIVVWLLVRSVSFGGTSVTVVFSRAPGVQADSTEVHLRDVEVGKVSKVTLSADGSQAIVELAIHKAQRSLLRAGTRFYLEGAKPSLSDPSSLKALISGAVIEMRPGPGPAARRFEGLLGAAPPLLAESRPYRLEFDGPVGRIDPGAPVTLKGFRVGEVTAVDLRIDAQAGRIDTGVSIALDPHRFHLASTSDFDAALEALIAHDLRARLTQSPPLLGGYQIELAIVPDAAPAHLVHEAGVEQIPVSNAPSGLENVIQAAGRVPIDQIGENLRAITAQVRTLSADPDIRVSLAHLRQALAGLDKTIASVQPQVGPTLAAVHETVDTLRRTALDLDQTVGAAREVIGAGPAAPDGSLEPALRHLSEAARAVRVLADYLDEHPESLVRGR